MGRSLGAVLAGLLVAFAVVCVVELGSALAFPAPQGMDPMDLESVRQHMSEVSTGAFALLLVAYVSAAFCGPLVARRVSRSTGRGTALVVAILFAAVCVLNFVRVPNPLWLVVATAVFVPMSSWMAMRGTGGTAR